MNYFLFERRKDAVRRCSSATGHSAQRPLTISLFWFQRGRHAPAGPVLEDRLWLAVYVPPPPISGRFFLSSLVSVRPISHTSDCGLRGDPPTNFCSFVSHLFTSSLSPDCHLPSLLSEKFHCSGTFGRFSSHFCGLLPESQLGGNAETRAFYRGEIWDSFGGNSRSSTPLQVIPRASSHLKVPKNRAQPRYTQQRGRTKVRPFFRSSTLVTNSCIFCHKERKT